MPRKKDMPTNPDAIAKSFIKHYDIATQKDLAKLNAKLDRIENQLKLYTNDKNISVKYKIPQAGLK